jgi:tRNA dimethylallyltransferase
VKLDSIIILGPTASGKTRVAAHLAAALQTDVVSADSRQVYTQMNIGTGKDYESYFVNGKQVTAHLVDLVAPGTPFDVHQFKLAASSVVHELNTAGKLPIICGGSGLYLQVFINDLRYTAVPVNNQLREELAQLNHNELLQYWEKLKPTSFNHIADLSTVKRLIRAIEINTYLQQYSIEATQPICRNPLTLGLHIEVEKRRQLIEQRLRLRLEQGLIAEVEQLLQIVSPAQLIFYGLEYKFVTQYLLHQYSYEQMVIQLTTAIQQFAKRQMTYFRKMEKDGLVIHWLDADRPAEVIINDAVKLIGEYQ